MNSKGTMNQKSCQGMDTFQRMNFLYQASHIMSEIAPGASTYYSNLLINLGKKSVLKVAPEIKRTICKSCRTLLIPYKTSKVEMSKKPRCMIIRCLKCNVIKRFPLKTGHKLWSEHEESTVEILDFAPSNKVQKKVSKKVDKTDSKKNCNNKSKNENPSEIALENKSDIVVADETMQK